MTLVRQYVLICELCGDGCDAVVDGGPISAKQARKIAKDNGWGRYYFGKDGPKDCCGKCVPRKKRQPVRKSLRAGDEVMRIFRFKGLWMYGAETETFDGRNPQNCFALSETNEAIEECDRRNKERGRHSIEEDAK